MAALDGQVSAIYLWMNWQICDGENQTCGKYGGFTADKHVVGFLLEQWLKRGTEATYEAVGLRAVLREHFGDSWPKRGKRNTGIGRKS